MLSHLYRKLQKAVEIVFYAGLRTAAWVTGAKPKHRAPDRRLLDEEILPRLAADDRFARVVFVGCDWYTQHVEDLFTRHGREYATLEMAPARARYGARRHIVGPLADLGHHFQEASLDLIVCNGVIGWGLNEPEEIERSMEACVRALADGGVLLLGWDDVPEKLPIRIEGIKALEALRPATPSGLGASVIRVDTYAKHTFAFFEKATAIA